MSDQKQDETPQKGEAERGMLTGLHKKTQGWLQTFPGGCIASELPKLTAHHFRPDGHRMLQHGGKDAGRSEDEQGSLRKKLSSKPSCFMLPSAMVLRTQWNLPKIFSIIGSCKLKGRDRSSSPRRKFPRLPPPASLTTTNRYTSAS